MSDMGKSTSRTPGGMALTLLLFAILGIRNCYCTSLKVLHTEVFLIKSSISIPILHLNQYADSLIYCKQPIYIFLPEDRCRKCCSPTDFGWGHVAAKYGIGSLIGAFILPIPCFDEFAKFKIHRSTLAVIRRWPVPCYLPRGGIEARNILYVVKAHVRPLIGMNGSELPMQFAPLKASGSRQDESEVGNPSSRIGGYSGRPFLGLFFGIVGWALVKRAYDTTDKATNSRHDVVRALCVWLIAAAVIVQAVSLFLQGCLIL
jgi:hypothetical protein